MIPQRALVVGLARSGRAAALALAARGVEVVAADRSAAVDASGLAEAGVDVRLGSEDPALLDGVGLLVKSPGVPGESPLPSAARGRGIPVWSEVELGFRLLPGHPLVGITGTNGKTTTTELTGAIFRAAGLPVAVAGNVGTPLVGLAGTLAPGAWLVCELSSFQLEDIAELRPRIGVLLNVEPDHLDRYACLGAYVEAKLRLFENQERDDVAVVPRGFGALPGRGRRVEFHASDPLPAEPLIPGAHNRENAAAATAAARAAGIDDESIGKALRAFPGVPHRLEPVGEIGGVRFVNDSKATNTAAARRALAVFDAPLHLVLGGSLKGESFDELAAALPPSVRSIHLIGEATAEIAAALDRAGAAYERDGDLATAVERAARLARPGEIVLLSPACASYDQFRNFEHRGDEFRRIVASLGR